MFYMQICLIYVGRPHLSVLKLLKTCFIFLSLAVQRGEPQANVINGEVNFAKVFEEWINQAIQ